jgi:hypothetical protein
MSIFATGVPVNERWSFAAAILERAEQGASHHCVEQIRDSGGEIVRIWHPRLNITISFA